MPEFLSSTHSLSLSVFLSFFLFLSCLAAASDKEIWMLTLASIHLMYVIPYSWKIKKLKKRVRVCVRTHVRVCVLVRWWVMQRNPYVWCHTMSPFNTHTKTHLQHMCPSVSASEPDTLFSLTSLRHSLFFATVVALSPSTTLPLLMSIFFILSRRWDGSSPGSGRLCQRQPATLPCFCQGWLCCER